MRRERPRLAVFRSDKHIYAQVIDDGSGKTVAAASTRDKALKGKTGGNVEAAKKVAAAHDIPHAYDSVADMIAKEKPDIVDICTPPKTHASIAIDAMHRGCHVLIEKPMAMSVAEDSVGA